MGSTGGSPDPLVLEQVLVDEGQQGGGVAKRGNASDSEAGLLADELGVGFAKRLTDAGFDKLFVDAITAAGDYQKRALAAFGFEDEGFNDLANLAADSLGGFNGGAGGIGQLDDLEGHAEGLEGLLDFLGAGAERCGHVYIHPRRRIQEYIASGVRRVRARMTKKAGRLVQASRGVAGAK